MNFKFNIYTTGKTVMWNTFGTGVTGRKYFIYIFHKKVEEKEITQMLQKSKRWKRKKLLKCFRNLNEGWIVMLRRIS